MFSVGLQALVGSSMYLSTYLPSFTIKKKHPQKKQKKVTIYGKIVLHMVHRLPIGFLFVA
jgi:hypothetical protein